MMRSARRASLLIEFSLLASAATTYAECAWMLWMDAVTPPAGPEERPSPFQDACR